MSCAECWADIPRNSDKCVRCGAKFTGGELKVTGLFRAYPWLGPLLACSFGLTFWALTRRPPAPPEEVIPPAVEPAASAEAPVETPAPEPVPFVFPPPESAPSAPAAAPAAVRSDSAPPPPPAGAANVLGSDGMWHSDPKPR